MESWRMLAERRVYARPSTEEDAKAALEWIAAREGKTLVQLVEELRAYHPRVPAATHTASGESTLRDPVELIRELIEPANRREFRQTMSIYAPDAVFDTASWEMGAFEGRNAIRRLFEDWVGGFEDFAIEAEEVLDLGNGIALAVFCQRVRPFGGGPHERLRAAWVYEWARGMVVRVTAYRDVDEARAVAARLAATRR
jgi:ketosteroid isomerase-like protein